MSWPNDYCICYSDTNVGDCCSNTIGGACTNNTCVNYAASCPSNTLITWGPRSTGDNILIDDMLKITAEINHERIYRSCLSGSSFGVSSKTNMSTIEANDFTEIKDAINDNISSATGTGIGNIIPISLIFTTGNTIYASELNTLRSKVNELKTSCFCDSQCTCNTQCGCYSDCGCDYSDKRLKENISYDIEEDSDKLLNICPIKFSYINEENKKHYGVIAQDVEREKLDILLSKDDNGYFMVNYKEMIPLLLFNLQKANKRIEKIEKKLGEIV